MLDAAMNSDSGESYLDGMYNDGWELVTCTNKTFIFKRRANEPLNYYCWYCGSLAEYWYYGHYVCENCKHLSRDSE